MISPPTVATGARLFPANFSPADLAGRATLGAPFLPSAALRFKGTSRRSPAASSADGDRPRALLALEAAAPVSQGQHAGEKAPQEAGRLRDGGGD